MLIKKRGNVEQWRFSLFTSCSSVFRKCIECLGFQTGPFSKNCSQACTSISEFKMVETLPPGKPCDVRDVESCRVFFAIKQLDGEDNYTAQILKTRGKRHVLCNWKVCPCYLHCPQRQKYVPGLIDRPYCLKGISHLFSQLNLGPGNFPYMQIHFFSPR